MTPIQYPYQLLSINFLRLTLSEIQQGLDFKTQGHYCKVKLKSKPHHDVPHLHTLTNITTKYHLPTPYSFLDIAQTRFLRSRTMSKFKSRSHHDIAHLHPPSNVATKSQLPTPYSF